MTSKAIWLLDLDGVINACPRNPDPPPGVWPRSDWVSVEVSNRKSDTAWPILAARAVVDFIRDIHESGLAEVRWHSTWQDEANKVGAALGLPEFEVEDAPEWRIFPVTRGWWKLPAARRALVRNSGHLVWTDDDACHPDLPKDERRLFRDSGALIIAPNPYQGLTPANLDRIRFYLQGAEEE
jgi:hypothetical protein